MGNWTEKSVWHSISIGFSRQGDTKRQANCAELMIGHMKRLSECGRFFSEIPRIAQKRAADIRHMHAQLMGSSGERRKPNQRKFLKNLFHGIL